MSPVLDQTAWRVDALSLQWEELDAYASPPVSLLDQVVSKVVDQGWRRMILIAPGWPNMSWLWDLVNLLVEVPLLLPQVENLLRQPLPPQGHFLPESACLAPPPAIIQQQGFSQEVATRIDTPQRHSTKGIYK